MAVVHSVGMLETSGNFSDASFSTFPCRCGHLLYRKYLKGCSFLISLVPVTLHLQMFQVFFLTVQAAEISCIV